MESNIIITSFLIMVYLHAENYVTANSNYANIKLNIFNTQCLYMGIPP